ncbi:MAG TPA: hypothetical protein EYG67_05060 [Campylobacterales bacterium]|nr:hypothetical protein [Campylobacterales bacterium]HIP40903.1 hypothetical protein [Campylobacterales bacterium]
MVTLTKHIKEKMSQRGINKELLELVLIYGVVKKDKILINKKRSEKYLKKLDKHNRKFKRLKNQLHIKKLNKIRSLFLKIRDKKGVTLVIMGETLITTYNTNMRVKRKRRYKGQKKPY